MINDYSVSVRQTCILVHPAKSSFLYKAKDKDNQPVIKQLSGLVEKHPAIGFWMCYYRIRQRGLKWNQKQVYRVYIKH